MDEIQVYIKQFSTVQQARMQEVYTLIKECCPQAQEKMSWGMPTFVYHGNLIHFAQNKKHLGIYPGENGVKIFIDKLDKLELTHSKGAIQIPDTTIIPYDLLKEIIAYRIKENEEIASKKPENNYPPA